MRGIHMYQTFEHLSVMHQTIEKRGFEYQNFQRSNIENTHIQNCTFDDCDFSRSNLINLRITDCRFVNCKFLNADLGFCKFSNCTFKDCDFSLSEIENANFFKVAFWGAKFISSRLANSTFMDVTFTNVDLNGSTTKFNCFEESTWTNSVFGNCTIDYNVALRCKFIATKMNLETLGSVWGIQEEDLENITFLSLGREIADNRQDIYHNYDKYLLKKRLCLEAFTFHVSLKKEDIYDNSEQLLNSLDKRYVDGQYLSLHLFHIIFMKF